MGIEADEMKKPSLRISLPGQLPSLDDQHVTDEKGEGGFSAIVVESKPLLTLPREPEIVHPPRTGMRPRKASIFIEHCHEDDQPEPNNMPTHIEHRVLRDESWPLSRHAEAGLGTYRLAPPSANLHDPYATGQSQSDNTYPEITNPSPVHHLPWNDQSPYTKNRRRLSKPRGGLSRTLSDLLCAAVCRSPHEAHLHSKHAAEDKPRDTSLGYHVSQSPKLASATNNTTAASIDNFSVQSWEERRQPTSTANVLLDIRPASRLGNRTSLNVHLPDAFSPLHLPEMEADSRKEKAERTLSKILANSFPVPFSRDQDASWVQASTSSPQQGSRRWSNSGSTHCAAQKFNQFCVSEIRIFLPVLAGLLLAWTCLWCAITFLAIDLSQHGQNGHFTPAIIWFSTSLVSCVILTSILSCLVTRREVMARRERARLPSDEEGGTSQPTSGHAASASNIMIRQRSATQPVPFEFDPVNGIRAFLDKSEEAKKLSDASSEAISPGTDRRHHVTLSRVLSAGVRKSPVWQETTENLTNKPRRDQLLDEPAISAVVTQSEKAKSDNAWWRVSKDSSRLRRYIEHLEAQYEVVRQHRAHNITLRATFPDNSEPHDFDQTDLSAAGSDAQNELRLSAIGLAYSTPTSEEGKSQEQAHFEPSELFHDESFVSAHQYPISKHTASVSSCSSIRTVSHASGSSAANSNPFNLYTMDNITSAGTRNYVHDEPLLRSRIFTLDDSSHPHAVEEPGVFGLEHSNSHIPVMGHHRAFSEEKTIMEMQILSGAATQHAPHGDMYSPLDCGFTPALRLPVGGGNHHFDSIKSIDHDISLKEERTPIAAKAPRLDSHQIVVDDSQQEPGATPHTPLHRIVTEAGTPLEELSAERRPCSKDRISCNGDTSNRYGPNDSFADKEL